MGTWAFVAIVAIIVWGIVQTTKMRDRARHDADDSANVVDREEGEREIQELRERIRVLERIATDANTPEARKIQDISDQIERLRDR